MQPAPKMLLLSGPVVLAGLVSLLPTNSFLTLLSAILSMRAVVAANIPCYVIFIAHIEYCKHLQPFQLGESSKLPLSRSTYDHNTASQKYWRCTEPSDQVVLRQPTFTTCPTSGIKQRL